MKQQKKKKKEKKQGGREGLFLIYSLLKGRVLLTACLD